MLPRQYLPQVLIFKDVNKTQEFADGLPPGSEVHMNQKSSYISTDSFVKCFKEHFLKNKASDKVILLSRWPQSSLQLLFTVSDCCRKIRYYHSVPNSLYTYRTAFGEVFF